MVSIPNLTSSNTASYLSSFSSSNLSSNNNSSTNNNGYANKQTVKPGNEFGLTSSAFLTPAKPANQSDLLNVSSTNTNDLLYSSTVGIGSFLNTNTPSSTSSSFYSQTQQPISVVNSSASSSSNSNNNKNLVLYNNDIFNKYYPASSSGVGTTSQLAMDSSTSPMYQQHNYQQQQQQSQSQNSNILNAFYNTNSYFRAPSDYQSYFTTSSNAAASNQYGYANGFGAGNQFQSQVDSIHNDLSFMQGGGSKLASDEKQPQVAGISNFEMGFSADNKPVVALESNSNGNFYLQASTETQNKPPAKRSQNGFQGKSSSSSNQSEFLKLVSIEFFTLYLK
jgi:hypothetical protein